ncbi:formate/nitrite transporter family protein [Anaerotignum sp. MB30-C6]|uniref:formate/nitrite transporter family protein n=1 Tax=Anaerotignum sp. MB30-C6 TaxID=3070814 RepID=UPI0027DBA2B2|nr:formate/nitrite transporter family protein [Anaerotignum sp. MB30-C6]WMI82281.1 formate/nitrite transporter family protein [Anaerotignum sp. MB30-C6]
MEKARQLISAIIAGMFIGMGGTVFLSLQNPVIGSFLFAIGLFTIVGFRLQLFTGRIGYLIFEKPVYFIELGITWLGNLIGTYVMAWLVQHTRIYQGISERVAEISRLKLEDNLLSIFILAFFCGVLMFIAIDLYRNLEGSMLKAIAIFIPVVVFILSGFEHVIANMFYFSLANAWDGHCLFYIVIMTLGNSLGGLLIPAYLKLFRLR